MDKLYTCEDVAKRYGVKVITVWEWIRKKQLPATKIAKKYYVKDDDIAQFENERRTVKT